MRAVVRWIEAAACGVAAFSAALVLWENADPAYRAAVGDPLWLVVCYAVAHAWMAWELARDGAWTPWIAVGRALAAYGFLAVALLVPPAGKAWMAASPSRYVYQLVDWGEGAELVLFAFLFLGRGVGNTIGAMVLTSPWWGPLRLRRPLLGRLVTAVPIVLVVLLGWQFTELFQYAVARDVARVVVDSLDCADVQAKLGQTTTDVRALKTRRFVVRISYACPATRVVVADEHQRMGYADGARQCCPPPG